MSSRKPKRESLTPEASESPKALLARYGLRPKRSFGQNFIADAGALASIAEAVNQNGAGIVVEIGAGLGHLTARLLEGAERVVAIERDRDLLPVLRARFAGVPESRLVLLEADAKEVDYRALFAPGPRPRVLAGNLPYQLTGPLLRVVCGLSQTLERAVWLVQAEVADRIGARPATSAYGALSVFVQAQYAVERRRRLAPGAFYPRPRVSSALVVLTPHAAPLGAESSTFQRLVSRAFSQRRKMLRNAWQGVSGLSASELENIARRAEIALDQRGETLEVASFLRMAKLVGDGSDG